MARIDILELAGQVEAITRELKLPVVAYEQSWNDTGTSSGQRYVITVGGHTVSAGRSYSRALELLTRKLAEATTVAMAERDAYKSKYLAVGAALAEKYGAAFATYS